MKKYRPFLFALLFLAILVFSCVLFTQIDMAVLNPKGWVGLEERNLLVVATLLMLIVVIPVFILTFFIVWRYNAKNGGGKHTPDWSHSTLAEIVWWGVPFIIVVILSVLNWKGCIDLDPFRPLDHPKKKMTIQVVALDWKWLFIYPEEKIAMVNFIQFPVDTPIQFEISGDAPMNSFWIPELGGQIFAMAGMRTELQLIANATGEYRGVSANLSGRGFSGMQFIAKASSQEDFDQWVQFVQGMKKESLNKETYKELAKQTENNPVIFYSLDDPDLFNWIVIKDMTPSKRGEINEVR
jgi:cytochrome o ubiquinol oxidase subunit 2